MELKEYKRRTGRPPRTDNPVSLKIYIASELKDFFSLLILGPILGKPRSGGWTSLVELLLSETRKAIQENRTTIDISPILSHLKINRD